MKDQFRISELKVKETSEERLSIRINIYNQVNNYTQMDTVLLCSMMGTLSFMPIIELFGLQGLMGEVEWSYLCKVMEILFFMRRKIDRYGLQIQSEEVFYLIDLSCNQIETSWSMMVEINLFGLRVQISDIDFIPLFELTYYKNFWIDKTKKK